MQKPAPQPIPVFRLSFLFLATAGIVYLSVCRVPPTPRWQIPHLDKFIHALEFLILSALAFRACAGFSPVTFWSRFRLNLALGYGFFWGAATEGLQFFLAFRTPSSADWAADLTGAVLGVGLARSLERRGRHAASS